MYKFNSKLNSEDESPSDIIIFKSAEEFINQERYRESESLTICQKCKTVMRKLFSPCWRSKKY